MSERYRTFREFYPFYLTEHVNLVSRRLHVVGTSLVVGSIIAGVATADWSWYVAAPLIGYGFAWVGHFFFEKNQPASFKRPLTLKRLARFESVVPSATAFPDSR